MTYADGEMFATVMAESIARALQPLRARLDKLEATPSVKYAGIYADGHTYPEGSLTTRSGSLWLAKQTTAARPGSDGSGWVLIVKRGDAE